MPAQRVRHDREQEAPRDLAEEVARRRALEHDAVLPQDRAVDGEPVPFGGVRLEVGAKPHSRAGVQVQLERGRHFGRSGLFGAVHDQLEPARGAREHLVAQARDEGVLDRPRQRATGHDRHVHVAPSGLVGAEGHGPADVYADGLEYLLDPAADLFDISGDLVIRVESAGHDRTLHRRAEPFEAPGR